MGGATCNMVIHSGNSTIRSNEFECWFCKYYNRSFRGSSYTPMVNAENVKLKYRDLKLQGSDIHIIELPVLANEQSMHEVF